MSEAISRNYAAIDVGSNTVRLMIASTKEPGNEFKPIHVARIITRLGEGFETDKILKPIPATRTLAALKEFKKLIDLADVQKKATAGTAVIREAKNKDWFIEVVRKKTGLPIKVLSGKQEAQLSLKGVFKAVQVQEGPALVLDIGGGSTEMILAQPTNPPEIMYIESLPLGVVKLTEKFLQNDPPGIDACRELRKEVRNISAPIIEKIKLLPKQQNTALLPEIMIATAGTPTTLAAVYWELEKYEPEKITGTVLNIEWLEKLAIKLANMTLKERQSLRGLERGREDIILAGLLILIEIMISMNFSNVLVSDPGLLEGLIWDLMDSNPVVEW
ncbi:MAG TPA: hypothetical protein ENI41_02165 [Deltaproteobacteria bacterium]|nr:hypothetical protein [Deltaproteobacteria bacterium]